MIESRDGLFGRRAFDTTRVSFDGGNTWREVDAKEAMEEGAGRGEDGGGRCLVHGESHWIAASGITGRAVEDPHVGRPRCRSPRITPGILE